MHFGYRQSIKSISSIEILETCLSEEKSTKSGLTEQAPHSFQMNFTVISTVNVFSSALKPRVQKIVMLFINVLISKGGDKQCRLLLLNMNIPGAGKSPADWSEKESTL